MRPIVYPYNFGSRSARALSEELRRRNHRAKRVRQTGNYTYWSNHLIINWGNSHLPMWPAANARAMTQGWLNHPAVVATASNKLSAFRLMEEAGDVQIPEFTNDWEVSRHWEGLVVARYKLSGHSGEGIQIIDTEEDTVLSHGRAPLYVKYMKKAKEYRVHVFQGRVIDVQQKRKRGGIDSDEVDYQVRNHDNGWVYCRDNVAPDQSVLDNAIAAVRALGLDFGGVDVIWNDHYEQATVLEINTAPGIENTSVQVYANAIERLL